MAIEVMLMMRYRTITAEMERANLEIGQIQPDAILKLHRLGFGSVGPLVDDVLKGISIDI